MHRSFSLTDLSSIQTEVPTERKISPRSFFRGFILHKIPQQAHDVSSGLVKTKKIAKQELARITEIESEGKTTNHVFRIKNFGFIKVGLNGCNATAIIERLVWECSSIFNVQGLFSPTSEMLISPRKAMKMSVEIRDEITPQQEKKFKRFSLDALSKTQSLKGSFQIAETGMLLYDLIKLERPLSSIINDENKMMMNLIDAVATSLGFGMMDAHSKNIFVTHNAKFKFFDNTKCLPHSNSVHAWADDIRLSYRCGLLELPECHQKLTQAQKKYLIEVADKFKSNQTAFEEFLMSEDVQRRLSELPLGWFDTEMIINATRERIEKLNMAAKSETVNSLVDLVCETVPYYRFFSFIYFIKEKYIKEGGDEKFWRIATVCAPIIPLPEALYLCLDLSINPYTLLGLSMQVNFTAPTFYKELKKMLKRKNLSVDRESVSIFATQFYHIANIDFKEVTENEVRDHLRNYYKESFIASDIPKEDDISEIPYYIDTDEEPWRLAVCIPMKEVRFLELDIYSFPGRIKIIEMPDLPPMKVHVFKDWIDTLM